MSEPFLGEIRMMSFGFPPRGWATCNGQLLPINQNQALFSLLGTTYGGNGQVNFALPNFQGRTPIHVGGGHTLGQLGGEQNHTLSPAEMPRHTHLVQGSTNSVGAVAIPSNAVLAPANNAYHLPSALTSLHPGSLTSAGGGQAHLNAQPYLALNMTIALQGIFPSQN